jgi:hypothetical protein
LENIPPPKKKKTLGHNYQPMSFVGRGVWKGGKCERKMEKGKIKKK